MILQRALAPRRAAHIKSTMTVMIVVLVVSVTTVVVIARIAVEIAMTMTIVTIPIVMVQIVAIVVLCGDGLSKIDCTQQNCDGGYDVLGHVFQLFVNVSSKSLSGPRETVLARSNQRARRLVVVSADA